MAVRGASWLGTATGSSTGYLTPPRFTGTGFYGGTPSPQTSLKTLPKMRHPQPLALAELLRPGSESPMLKPRAFFPSTSSQVLRQSRRIDELQTQIEEERAERHRIEKTIEWLSSDSAPTSCEEDSSTTIVKAMPCSLSQGSLASPPQRVPRLRSIQDSGYHPSLSRMQLSGPMSITGSSFGRTHANRFQPLSLVERRVVDAASLTLCSPHPISPQEARAAALSTIEDRGVGITYKPSAAPPWDMRPKDKPISGYSGILGV